MKKKEFAIGETFQFGLKKLKVVEREYGQNPCRLCAFACYCDPDTFLDFIYPFVGCCSYSDRFDNKDVYFVEVEEEECKR